MRLSSSNFAVSARGRYNWRVTTLPETFVPHRWVAPLLALGALVLVPWTLVLAYRWHGYTLAELAAYLGCHYSTVSRRLRREEQMLQCKT